ncbi:MAG TPA: hypothetical protein VIP11_14595 [Gemmatimonadaceae bacterium]
MKHPRVEALEKHLLAEHARLREAFEVADHEIVKADDGAGIAVVDRAEIAQIEHDLLDLQTFTKRREVS